MTDTTYEVIHEKGRVPIKAWTRGVPFEDEARRQLLNVAALPFIHRWVAAMPDVHWGIGATVGSVIPTVGAIIPAAVGVDIGCGMTAVRTTLTGEDLPDNLKPLRSAIEVAVPHGRTPRGRDKGSWGKPPPEVAKAYGPLELEFLEIAKRHPAIRKSNRIVHAGTLGTGNHFIEICLDEEGVVWFMLHSGSRGVGNRIGTYFIRLAKKEMEKWYVNLPDQDLAYFPEDTEHFGDYVKAVDWAQRFARLNRELMMKAVIRAVTSIPTIPEFSADRMVVDCHHNYVAREEHYGKNVWLTRKGAVRARSGDYGIIPGSMGARSFIVAGKGNPESFMSCSHGAGRTMSRREAKQRFSVEAHLAATTNVECRKDVGVLDETPAAYKPIDEVMRAQADLVTVVHELRQVVCVKG